MRRYSAIWSVCALLKVIAAYHLVNVVAGELSVSSRFSVTFFGLNIGAESVLLYWIARLLNTLGMALYAALPLWGLAEAIRMIANTEAYARGTYTLFRKRAEQQRQSAGQPQGDLKYSPPFSYRLRHTQQVPFPSHNEADDFVEQREQRYGRRPVQTLVGRAPIRTVTVFRSRAPHRERPPRPAGTAEAVDSMDNQNMQYLPFDNL